MRRALARTVFTWLALALVLLRPGFARAVGSTIDTVLFADGLGHARAATLTVTRGLSPRRR